MVQYLHFRILKFPLHKCWENCRNRCSTDLWIESEDCPIAASWCCLKVPILGKRITLRALTSAKGFPACPCSILPLRKGSVVHATAAYHNLSRTLIKHVDFPATLSPESPENGKSPNNTTNIHKYQTHSKTTTSPTTWSRNSNLPQQSPGISVWTSTHDFRLRSQSRIHCCFQTWHGQLSQQVGASAHHFSGGNC